MPVIARSVELFNQAFRLAWPHLSQSQLQRPDVSRLLSEAIQRRLKIGETDPVQIAAEAIKEIQRGD